MLIVKTFRKSFDHHGAVPHTLETSRAYSKLARWRTL
jgi:hypothetical protein